MIFDGRRIVERKAMLGEERLDTFACIVFGNLHALSKLPRTSCNICFVVVLQHEQHLFQALAMCLFQIFQLLLPLLQEC